VGFRQGRVYPVVDGIDPAIPDEIRDAAVHTKGVKYVTEVRVRWIGHRL
jgi:divalent metal cation (Fe/Co/Zn/Cd) transporter